MPFRMVEVKEGWEEEEEGGGGDTDDAVVCSDVACDASPRGERRPTGTTKEEEEIKWRSTE